MTSNANNTINAGINRPTAAEIILPGTKVVTPELVKLRSTWARLMDSGQTDEAEALANEIRCADTYELAIANGLAEIVLIARRAQEKRTHDAPAPQRQDAPTATRLQPNQPRSVSGKPSSARFDYTPRTRIVFR
ncbi:MAG: hypothetical protein RI947_425 [Candidatus Parcubacteria bacterium]|jgi:hypothetical protein